MTLTAAEVYAGLLQKNYFPSQRKDLAEIPPLFSSEALTPEIADKLLTPPMTERREGGFDTVSYTATRFDLVSRVLQIPFPKAYVDLCNCIKTHWNDIHHICGGSYSAIKPAKHEDGRVIIMDYDDRTDKEEWHVNSSFGKRFGIHTDITNFYPSIYTHAIAWAAVGFDKAKETKNDRTTWYNKLDYFQRQTTRNETKGVPIGPGTSNIIAEIILQNIDNRVTLPYIFGPLRAVDGGLVTDTETNSVRYRRYIDDYQGYTINREHADGFLRDLRVELAKYSLHLNARKTKICEIPDHSDDAWMTELQLAIPKDKYSFVEVKRFLDYATVLSNRCSGKSVMRYALRCILPQQVEPEKQEAFSKVFGVVLGFTFHYPTLIPMLSKLLIQGNEYLWNTHKGKIDILLADAIKNQRSDIVCWILYYFYIFGEPISEERAKSVIITGDCLSICCLYAMGQHEALILKFTQDIVSKFGEVNPSYELDKYWILLYQMFKDGKITNPYGVASDSARKTFQILQENRVSFITSLPTIPAVERAAA